MKRLALTLFVAVVVPACFLSVFRPDPVSAQPAPVVAGERWEYATLTYAFINGSGIWGITAEGIDAAGSPKQVLEKLDGRNPDGKTVSRQMLMNAMGELGWELVFLEEGGQPPVSSKILHFKRKKLPR